MAYAERSDIESQYGAGNVIKWADLENNGNANHIDDRVEWALAAAEADVNDLLRDGPYEIPFECPVPSLIKRMTASRAGILLYESRGVTDYDADGNAQDQLQWQRKQFKDDIKDILTKRKKLDVELTAVPYPQVIREDDCEEDG